MRDVIGILDTDFQREHDIDVATEVTELGGWHFWVNAVRNKMLDDSLRPRRKKSSINQSLAAAQSVPRG